MNWLTPLTGLYLALAVIPPLVLLYFLKLRRKPQPIACTLLWQRSVEDLRANAPFQRLRKSLLLFLQLLALGLLVAAVMQPQMQGGRLEGGRTVILIDNSASMTARDVEEVESRLEEAKRLAREQVERRYGGGILGGSAGETMIVAFSDRAEIYSQFTDSKQRLLAAIDRIRPTHGSTRIDEALKLARAHTTNVVDSMGEARPTGDPATIELYTDGRIDDLADHALRGEVLHYHPIGSPTPDNIAITSISVERPFDEPTRVQVFVAVLNFNASEVTCRLELSVNGNVPLGGVKDVTVPASTIDESTGALIPGRNNLVFTPFEQPRDAIIVVRNLREDDLAADDVAQLVVPPARRLRVALVDGGGFVLRTALEGLPLESLTLLGGAAFDELIAAGPIDTFDVVVLDGHAPESLPAGRYLVFGDPPPIGGLNPYGDPGGRQLVLDARDEHPAMRFVGMDDVFISRHQRIQPDDEVTVLAQGSETAVVVEYARPPMKLIYVAFDPLDSNWPLLRSFVTFVYNSVEYLGTSGEAVAAEGLEPGGAVSTRLPESATEIELRGPDGALRPVNVGDPSLFSWGPTRLTGVYTLSWSMPDDEQRRDRSFAVNLASEREGEIAALESITIGREDVERVGAEGSRYIPLWPWAIGVCLVVLLFEWYVYNRKMYW